MSKPEVQGVSLARTIKWIEKTEGRDKFCKGIQYACRFLKFRYEQRGQKEIAQKVGALFGAMRDARKLFRLFKSLNEYKKLMDLLKKDQSLEDLILSIITRIGFLLYWIFDNLAILSKIKILSFQTKPLSKKGSTCWLIALLATLILTIKNLIKNLHEINAENRKLEYREGMKKLKAKQFDLILALIKTLGDIIPAGQGSQFFLKVFKFNANEGFCGLGGLASAVISSYQLYD